MADTVGTIPPPPAGFKLLSDEEVRKRNLPIANAGQSLPQEPVDNTPIFLSHAKPGPYRTQLAADEEPKFQQWVKENNVPWKDIETADYDMRGYWKAFTAGDKRAKQSEKGHYPDIWKTPYHKSFSSESQYALPTAPKWQDGKLMGSGGQVLYDETAPPLKMEPSPMPEPESPEGYIQKYSDLYSVDPEFVKATFGLESGLKQSATSKKGARGIAQLMPETAEQLGVDPDDPEDNVKGGVRYLSDLLDRFQGNRRQALAAYHAGAGAVEDYRDGTNKTGKNPHHEKTYEGIPPFSDGNMTTEEYVDAIMSRYQSGGRASSKMPPAPQAQKSEEPVNIPPPPAGFKLVDETSEIDRGVIRLQVEGAPENVINAYRKMEHERETGPAVSFSLFDTPAQKAYDKAYMEWKHDNALSVPQLYDLQQAAEKSEEKQGFWESRFSDKETPERKEFNKAYETWKHDTQLEIYKERLKFANGSKKELDAILKDIAEKAKIDEYWKALNDKLENHPIQSVWEILLGPVEPVQMSGIRGYPHIATGVYRAATAPTLEESFKGGTEAIGGVGEALTPLQYSMAGISPVTLAKYTIGTEVASGVGDILSEKMGLSPEAREFIASTSGLIGGLALGIHEHVNRDGVVHRDLVNEMQKQILTAPAETREAIANLVQKQVADTIMKRKRVIGPDGKVYKVGTRAQAEQLARKWIKPEAQKVMAKAQEGTIDPLLLNVGGIHGGMRPTGRRMAPSPEKTTTPEPYILSAVPLGRDDMILQVPVLNAQERANLRQDHAEREALQLLDKERQQRVVEEEDRRKRVADEVEKQKAAEFKITDRRRMVPSGSQVRMEDVMQQFQEIGQRLSQIAEENQYVDADDMVRSLLEKRPRGQALTESEKEVLRLWDQKKRLVKLSSYGEAEPVRNEQAQLESEADLAQREQKLREAAARAEDAAKKASTPEESEEKGAQADEATKRAEEIKTAVDRQRAEREAAKQKQQRYPVAPPISLVVTGKTTEVRLPDGRKVGAKYAVVRAADLVISHDPETFQWNPAYEPRRMQPRDYDKNKEAQAGVIAGGQNFEPNAVHNTDDTGHNGPPVILSDGRVAGGNGRAMRTVRAYQYWDAEALRQHLVDNAGMFGLDPGSIPTAEERPVLVRVLDESPEDLADLINLGQDLNRTETRGFTAAEQSVMTADRITPGTLEWVSSALDASGDETSIRDLMRNRGNELVERMMKDGVFDPTKRAQFVTSTGELTEDAKRLFENGLLGKVIDDADLIATMPPSIKNKLFRALAALAKIKAADPAWDFTDYLQEGVRNWKRIEAVGETLDSYGKKSDSVADKWYAYQKGRMIPEPPDHPAVEALTRRLEQSGKDIKEAFTRYAEEIEGKQEGLSFRPPSNPRDAFNQHIAEKVGVEVKEGEWGTVMPVQEAAPEPEVPVEDVELRETPDETLRADYETVLDLYGAEDPITRQYAEEMARRGLQEPRAGVMELLPSTAQPEGKPDVMAPIPEDQEEKAVAQKITEAVRTAGPMTEAKLREILAQHPAYSMGKINASLEIWKNFAEKYLGVPFDQWLAEHVAGVEVMGEGPAVPGAGEIPTGVLFQPLEEAHIKAIRDGGGVPIGLQEGYGKYKAVALFNDPETGTTIALEPSKLTPEAVRKEIARSRKKFKPMPGEPPLAQHEWGAGMSPEELESWVRAAGRKLQVEDHGQQLTLFGAPENVYRLRNSRGESVLVTQTQMEALRLKVPEVKAKVSDEGTRQGSLFQAGEPVEVSDGRDSESEVLASMGAKTHDLIVNGQVVGEITVAMTGDRLNIIWAGEPMKTGKTVLDLTALSNKLGPSALRRIAQDLGRRYGAREIGYSREGGAAGRNIARGGDVLVERVYNLHQGKKGAVQFLEDGRALIHLMENADISTVFHEFAHVARRNLKGGDKVVVEKWLKIQEGLWKVEHEEKFARAFERYLHDGEAPTPAVKGVFARIRDWMLEVYQTVKKSSIDIKMPDEVRAMFDRMVAGVPEEFKEPIVEPPLEAGTVRLYRGEGGEGGSLSLGKEKAGRNFTTVRDKASRYMGKGGRLIYVDVPQSYVDDYRLGSDSPNETVFLLSESDVKSAKPLVAPKSKTQTADRGKLTTAIEDEARTIQESKEKAGEELTPEQRVGATKIAEGGAAFTDEMTDSKFRVFPTAEEAVHWAKTNKDDLKGVKLYQMPDGRAFAHFLPKSEAVLFQETDPVELDRRMRLIDERMGKIIPEAERAKLGKMRQELEAQKGKKALPVMTPAPGSQPIRLWTPEGEVEVGGKRETGTERQGTLPNVPAPFQEPKRAGGLVDEAGGPARSKPSGAPGRSVGRGVRGGRGVAAAGEPRRTLQDVPAPKSDAPVNARGEAVYDAEDWKERVERLRLPENAPAPTVRLPQAIARMLRYPGQVEIVESALSGLKQHDATIIASPTGAGKTWLQAAVASQLVKPGMKVLVLTVSQDLIHKKSGGLIPVYRDFDVNLEPLPSGVSDPGEGVWVSTYSTAIGRDGIENAQWDLVVADEIGQARKWYSSKTGAMMKTMGQNAKKVLYLSASPAHTALELGHMDKLGLWNKMGFAEWGRQFGIYRDSEGNLAGGNAPKKLLKLRENLIERGQYQSVEKDLDGFNTSFAMVRLTPQQLQGIKNINEAFRLAEVYAQRRGKNALIRSIRANAATYIKKYLERSRLPQAVELAKKLEAEGWKVIVFSETRSERREIFDFLKEADESFGGRISELMPPLVGVPETLGPEFGEDLANYSGSHSAARTEEMDAFLENQKKHIYVSYAAGGIGVSLHDTAGDAPRAVIYLGPPYSGVMFDQAIGRAWRYGTRSNVHAIFLTSNARPEIEMIAGKIAPRMSSLRALVSGIHTEDPFVNTLHGMDSNIEEQVGYELGQNIRFDARDYEQAENTHAIQDWQEVKIEPATTAMNKGMKMPEMEAPKVMQLFQADEPPDPFKLPDKLAGKDESDRLQEQYRQSGMVPGVDPEGDMPRPVQSQLADLIGRRVQYTIGARTDPETSPAGVARVTWKNDANFVNRVFNNVGGSGPVRAAKAVNTYLLTHGRQVIRNVTASAGVPEIGRKMAYDIQEYHIQHGNEAGPLTHRWFDILKDNDISVTRKIKVRDNKGHEKEVSEHHNMVMAIEGKQPPANARIARAVEDTRRMLADVRKKLANAGVEVEVDDGGRRRYVPFSEIMDDPNYWPHQFDPDYEIKVTDPDTGEVTSVTLSEILGGKPGEKKWSDIIDQMAKEQGVPRSRIEDYLEKRHRDHPLVGNVERARKYDLPYYMTGPEAMTKYLWGVGEAIARTRTFGQRRQKLERAIESIPGVEQRKVVRTVMDSLLAQHHMTDDTRSIVGTVANWSVMSKMSFSAVKALGHSGWAALHTDTRSYLRGLWEGVSNYREAHDLAVDSGAALEYYTAAALREFGLRRKSIASRFLSVVQFHRAYNFGRVVSDATARHFLEVRALKKLQTGRDVDYYRRSLKEVFHLTDEQIDKAVETGSWTEEDLNKAGKALADRTMFTNDPTELPPWWRARSQDPVVDSALSAWRVVTMLKGYSFKVQVMLRDRLIAEARKGNFRPWIPFLTIIPAMGSMIMGFNSLLRTGRKKQVEEETGPGTVAHDYATAMADMMGVSVIQMVLESASSPQAYRVHDPVRTSYEFVAGPALSDFAHTVIQLPAELYVAEDSKTGRGMTAEQKREKAWLRWAQSTFPATRPVTRYVMDEIGPAPREQESSNPYRMQPLE